ncbi:hypothetical protein CPB85DRAFT_1257859 [Mucidula mucida]|nr:hypothetical protein CPB85DRAFT_1257859 [Mucidula mucida]
MAGSGKGQAADKSVKSTGTTPSVGIKLVVTYFQHQNLGVLDGDMVNSGGCMQMQWETAGNFRSTNLLHIRVVSVDFTDLSAACPLSSGELGKSEFETFFALTSQAKNWTVQCIHVLITRLTVPARPPVQVALSASHGVNARFIPLHTWRKECSAGKRAMIYKLLQLQNLSEFWMQKIHGKGDYHPVHIIQQALDELGFDLSLDWRRQPADKVSKLYAKVLKQHPFMVCYLNNWATKEMAMSTIKNKRAFRVKREYMPCPECSTKKTTQARSGKGKSRVTKSSHAHESLRNIDDEDDEDHNNEDEDRGEGPSGQAAVN